jgi:hypothetical protein
MDDGRLDDMERRMQDLDRRESALEKTMEKAMERSRAAVGVIVPPESRQHLRAAWRENILAMRSMLDHWADRLDDSKSSRPANANDAHDGGRENIPID